MKRILLTAIVFASLAMATPLSARAATRVGISVRIGDPYRGASLYFRSAPHVVLVPRTRVYVVRDYDYDLYRYADDWYYFDDGYWYCADSYRGPFVRIRYTSVPHQIRYVCESGGYRRYGGPPAHAPAWGYRRNYGDRDYDRDWDRHRVRARSHDRDRDREWDRKRRGDRDWDRDDDRDWRYRDR